MYVRLISHHIESSPLLCSFRRGEPVAVAIYSYIFLDVETCHSVIAP